MDVRENSSCVVWCGSESATKMIQTKWQQRAQAKNVCFVKRLRRWHLENNHQGVKRRQDGNSDRLCWLLTMFCSNFEFTCYCSRSTHEKSRIDSMDVTSLKVLGTDKPRALQATINLPGKRLGCLVGCSSVDWLKLFSDDIIPTCQSRNLRVIYRLHFTVKSRFRSNLDCSIPSKLIYI